MDHPTSGQHVNRPASAPPGYKPLGTAEPAEQQPAGLRLRVGATAVAGIWCDMNEPIVFVPLGGSLPLDAVHPGGGETKLHAQVHNLYGSLMARATRDGLQRLRPDRRPFVISRAASPGCSVTRCSGPATTPPGGSISG